MILIVPVFACNCQMRTRASTTTTMVSPNTYAYVGALVATIVIMMMMLLQLPSVTSVSSLVDRAAEVYCTPARPRAPICICTRAHPVLPLLYLSVMPAEPMCSVWCSALAIANVEWMAGSANTGNLVLGDPNSNTFMVFIGPITCLKTGVCVVYDDPVCTYIQTGRLHMRARDTLAPLTHDHPLSVCVHTDHQ